MANKLGFGFFVSIASKIRTLLSRKQKFYLLILFFLTLLLSGIETLGVSVIMPFISIASNPALIDTGTYLKFFTLFGFTSRKRFIFAFGVLIVLFYILRAVYNIVYTYVLNRFAFGTYRHMAHTIYGKYLNLPFTLYLKKNSAELTQLVQQCLAVSNLILFSLQVCSDLIVVVMLYVFMLAINWYMTLGLTIILAVLVSVILKTVIKQNKSQGANVNVANMGIFKVLNETFGSFKIMRLKGIEKYNENRFSESTQTISKAMTSLQTLTMMPRCILESAGFSLLVLCILFVLLKLGSAESIVPIISMYALSLFRILPSINKMLANINQISFYSTSLDAIYKEYDQPIEVANSDEIKFEKALKLENITFKYEENRPVLNGISFNVEKGDKIGITGPSGGGKSTLIDIIIGMQMPETGSLLADDIPITLKNVRSWRKKIGYIPQNIYLFDSNIAENVVFGSVYNEDRIIKVLKMANIWDFLSEKSGIKTMVGEGGVQLSGGQKQRIAIARALYDDPDILVLDEATSALDNATEAKIMDEIYDVGRDKTLIIIAHRLSTLERCNKRFIVEHGIIYQK
ncbi:multidrug transporter [Spirochaetia bacterium]|nr:multidrug transporter [Spirochaetia bacterium]